MAGYTLSTQQRQVIKDIVHQVVCDGFVYFDKITLEVSKRLIATKQPWAVAFARSTHLHRTMRYTMTRMVEGGLLACTRGGPDTRWIARREAA